MVELDWAVAISILALVERSYEPQDEYENAGYLVYAISLILLTKEPIAEVIPMRVAI